MQTCMQTERKTKTKPRLRDKIIKQHHKRPISSSAALSSFPIRVQTVCYYDKQPWNRPRCFGWAVVTAGQKNLLGPDFSSPTQVELRGDNTQKSICSLLTVWQRKVDNTNHSRITIQYLTEGSSAAEGSSEIDSEMQEHQILTKKSLIVGFMTIKVEKLENIQLLSPENTVHTSLLLL